MSNTSTNISFSSIDYKGVNSLSSYALPITPFRFIADQSDLINRGNNSHRVVWDFGDGTISKSFSASKFYDFPGVYTVTLVVYDCNNNAQISSKTRTLRIYDYAPFTFTIENYGRLTTEDGDYILTEDGDYISTEIIDYDLLCGAIEGPFGFNMTYPPYQPPTSIFYSVSGSDSQSYWDINKNKFSHLQPFYSLYEQQYNYSIQSNQYVEINRITPNVSDIYAKVDNDEIVICDSSDAGSCLVGRQGSHKVYIKDDTPKQNVYWKFFYDKTKNVLPFYNGNTNHLNNLGVVLKTNIVENEPNHISITSNGLDGEGYTINSFNISPIKFYNTKISFILKLKDIYNYSVKNFNEIALSSLDINVLNLPPNTYYTLSSLNHTLSSQDHGGSFRGYLIFPNLTANNPLESVYINVLGTFTDNLSNTYSLSGNSSAFSIYPQNYYDLYKKGEDFNPTQTLMDLRFQETLLDKDVLFRDFLGGILGDENSDHQGIGLSIYEKIKNFVSNTQDIDVCEVEFLNSLGQFVNYTDVDEDYQYPEKIKRLINLGSISKSNLTGVANKFKQNLDIKGRTSKDEFGINIGDKINTLTYRVSAGTPIVALEKFSNTYNLLNTYQPVSAVGSWVYPLSTYTSDFGWPLVLPSDFQIGDMEKYYLFFNYNDMYDNTVMGGVVDYTNPKTTISKTLSSSELFGNYGIFENMFIDTLYQSLSLVQ